MEDYSDGGSWAFGKGEGDLIQGQCEGGQGGGRSSNFDGECELKWRRYEKMKNEKMILMKPFCEQLILSGNVQCKQLLRMEELQM